jgi:hypothetical protein
MAGRFVGMDLDDPAIDFQALAASVSARFSQTIEIKHILQKREDIEQYQRVY